MRVIYFLIPEAERIDFIDLYGKDEKDDLTPKEKRALNELAKVLRDEAIAHFKRSQGES